MVRAKPTRKEINAFLKQQGLTRRFNTFRKLKSKPKRSIEVIMPNYDGESRRIKLQIIKVGKNKIQIRDTQTLKVLSRRKGTIAKVLRDITKTERVSKEGLRGLSPTTKKHDDWKINTFFKRTLGGIKNSVIKTFYNEQEAKLRRVEFTNKIKRSMFGSVNIRAKYTSSDGSSKTIRARSTFQPIKNNRDLDRAIEEAIHNGSAVAGFSPIGVDVFDYWIEYVTDRIGVKRPVLR